MIDTIGLGIVCFLLGVVFTNAFWIRRQGKQAREHENQLRQFTASVKKISTRQ